MARRNKWEYKVCEFHPRIQNTNLETFLDNCGNDGWELIKMAFQAEATMCIFKRQKIKNEEGN